MPITRISAIKGAPMNKSACSLINLLKNKSAPTNYSAPTNKNDI